MTIILISVAAWYACALIAFALLYMEKITDEDAHLRFDESEAPLAPRSRIPSSLTKRQSAEKDYPHWRDENGYVQVVR